MLFSFTRDNKTLELDVDSSIYYPREDSILLADVLLETPFSGYVLELGCGCGFLSVIASEKAESVIATDVDALAVKNAKKNVARLQLKNVIVTRSDLFSNVRGAYDLIIFNPPYLPVEGEKTYAGGKTGRDVIAKFAEECDKYLKPEGKILLLVSSLTGEKQVRQLFRDKAFDVTTVGKKKIPWEELLVLQITKVMKEEEETS